MVAGATIPYLLHKMCTQWAGLLNSSPFDLSKYNINLSTYIEVNFRLQVSKTLAFNYEILHRFGNSFIFCRLLYLGKWIFNFPLAIIY